MAQASNQKCSEVNLTFFMGEIIGNDVRSSAKHSVKPQRESLKASLTQEMPSQAHSRAKVRTSAG